MINGSKPLTCHPPFLWPSARFWAGHEPVQQPPPAALTLIQDGDLISGVLVGAGDNVVSWIQQLSKRTERPRTVHLVFVIYPACSTRSEHLFALQGHLATLAHSPHQITVRLLPVAPIASEDRHFQLVPPSVVHTHEKTTGRSLMWVGSVGDLGADPLCPASFNALFEPDTVLADHWRAWFQHIQDASRPLTADATRIPDLTPARGDPKASELWRAYCEKMNPQEETPNIVVVDTESGEAAKNEEVATPEPWDGGVLALDETAAFIERLYAGGVLVTVNEGTRIKPLALPVKAKLLGQHSERVFGTVRQRQSFTLQILDDDINAPLAKARSIRDPVTALSFPLGKDHRWIPEAAKSLLEREVEARNKRGLELLKEALGADVGTYIAGRADQMRADLNKMYSELGRGQTVPSSISDSILSDAKERLQAAFDGQITPSPAYNRISAPRLAGTAVDDGSWEQPLSLLSAAACRFRKLLVDPYEPRKFSKMAFSVEDFREECRIFDDTILTTPDYARAQRELAEIEELLDTTTSAREKCKVLQGIIQRGKQGNES